MKKKVRSIWLVAMSMILILTAAACSSGTTTNEQGQQGQSEQQKLKPQMFSSLTTASSSSFYAYFVGVANAISSQYPELQITVTETGGATDNLQRLKQGESTFSLGVSVSDYKAFNGLDGFEDSKNENLRALWYFAPAPFNYVVSKASGIESFEDLKGKSFSLGGSGTSTEKSTEEIFNLLGIETNPYNGSMNDAQEAFSNRRIQGLTKSGRAPDSYVQQVAANLDIRLLGFTDEQLAKIQKELPYYSPATIAAGSYRGVDEDVQTVQFMLGALLDASVSQEVGYTMWKAIWSEQGRNIINSSYPAGAEINVPELTLSSPIPLHAGAVQFLKEQGLDVPDELIPPEYKE